MSKAAYYVKQHELKYWQVFDQEHNLVMDFQTKLEAELWCKHLTDAYWAGYWHGGGG